MTTPIKGLSSALQEYSRDANIDDPRTLCNLVSKSELVNVKTLHATCKHQKAVHMTLRIKHERSENISFQN